MKKDAIISLQMYVYMEFVRKEFLNEEMKSQVFCINISHMISCSGTEMASTSY
jgi:hypothetical protein